ncbi:conserved hypothetical protein [Prochlorococcus marinus str. MIT 9515]|uniref:Uncharacterized protein n=1 Tax=Prochlorococcus marinus (strain MIT 9515) TaxID=167542 RepID=A2BXY9_PROM5|nr:hypothetical protein [Prochlorococcus marinus]ABM72650.1 conserved hypothetical protein [Prochlorococcus marinus str. MIT 9515]
MKKKTINLKEASFTQAINISAQWCKEWGEDLLSEEVLADRMAELIKTKNGLRGFFAYALSDQDCYLLDKLPFSVVFKLQECGKDVVEIVIKNLIMSSAQIIVHDRENNLEYKSNSENISERCKSILRVLDTNYVTKNINQIMNDLDNLGNSFDNSKKYDDEQKEFIKHQISDIAQ